MRFRSPPPIWSTFPVELEVVVGVLLLLIVGTLILAVRRDPRSTDPLERARLTFLADAPRWIGVAALMVGVFGFFLAFETTLVRAAVSPDTGWTDWEESHARMSRFLALSVLVCVAGFATTWGLGFWMHRRRTE